MNKVSFKNITCDCDIVTCAVIIIANKIAMFHYSDICGNENEIVGFIGSIHLKEVDFSGQ